MPALLRKICCLLALSSLPLTALAAEPMPDLLPLLAADLPEQCGCMYGAKKDVPLIFWSWENDKQNAVIRETGGPRKLVMRSEKYFPAQHEPPHPGDRMTLQLSQGNWNIQTVSEVTRACSARAKTCKGTHYRSRLILQWAGRQREEVMGWGYCGC